MDEPKKELVRAWIDKARSDLGSAQRLATEPDPFLDTAIYHCQQAAEKAFKAFWFFTTSLLRKYMTFLPWWSFALKLKTISVDLIMPQRS